MSSADSNRGGIYDAATAALIKKLPDFRPTGIDARADILFTGRLASNLDFGNVYKLNADNSLSIVISNLPLRGIAADSSANIFVSTTPDQYGSFLGNSIYEFSSVEDYNPSTAKLIATLGGTGSTELTFDNQGRLYSLYTLGVSTEIIQITAVPEPETYAMLMAGLGLVSFMVRRRKTA